MTRITPLTTTLQKWFRMVQSQCPGVDTYITDNIIYSYKYLESDLIKHCHVIFIHSLGQPLIVRSHSKVHRSRGNPKEISTWASRVSNYSHFPWFNRQQTWRLSQSRRYSIVLGVWCKNIRYTIPIITLVGVWPDRLSPLEKLGRPRVTLISTKSRVTLISTKNIIPLNRIEP